MNKETRNFIWGILTLALAILLACNSFYHYNQQKFIHCGISGFLALANTFNAFNRIHNSLK